MPTYPVFIGVFYGLAGIALVWLTSFGNALHLVFPLAAGFALIGPFFAVGLYEMSRRRERGFRLRGATPSLWRARRRFPPSSRSGSCCWRFSPPGSARRN